MTGLTSEEVQRIRKDFPILASRPYGKPLVYLDSAATTQKPVAVMEALNEWYTEHCANVHRGVHALSVQSSVLFEHARDKVADFIHASSRDEVIFVRGTTEAINLVAQSYLRPRLHAGDEILVTHMEHHSNIVPWQLVCEQTGAILKIVPITDAGEIDLEAYYQLLGPRTRLVSLVHVSNALGTINPVEDIITAAHAQNVPVMLDGAQAVSHLDIDMQALDCDFYAFSSHKLYGPTGVGVLYGKRELLETMPPYHGGGDMISRVTFEKTTYKELPYKFEAGTPDIAGAVGLGAAIDYVSAIGMDRIMMYEQELLGYVTNKMLSVPGVRLVGTAENKASILTFVMQNIHPHDIGTILDQQGIAIRSGHHCAMPLMERLKLPATARASFAFYNTFDEIDFFVDSLEDVRKVFV